MDSFPAILSNTTPKIDMLVVSCAAPPVPVRRPLTAFQHFPSKIVP